MRTFTTTEIDRLQNAQEAAMQDLCVRLVYSADADDYGNPAPTYSTGANVALACGLEHVSPAEVQSTGAVPVIDARLRLPVDTVLDERDRIRVTYRYGEAMTSPQDFEIIGPVRRGPSGLVLDLKLVTEE